MEGLRDNWLRLHLALAPLGTLAVTWLLVWSVGAGQWWANWNTLALTGQTVPLGGALYGSGVFVFERTVRMFWALALREKDIEKGREEGREVGREEGREVGREEGREVGCEEGREYERKRIERVLRESGVVIPPEVEQEISAKEVDGNQH